MSPIRGKIFLAIAGFTILTACSSSSTAIVIRTENTSPHIPFERLGYRVFTDIGSKDMFVGYENHHDAYPEYAQDLSYVNLKKHGNVHVTIYFPKNGKTKHVSDTLTKFDKPVVVYYVGRPGFGKNEGAQEFYFEDSISIMKKWGDD